MGLEEKLQRTYHRIQQYGYAVAIEITNGLRDIEQLKHKEFQARNAKKFLRKLVEQKVPVKSGLILSSKKGIPNKKIIADYKLKLSHHDIALAERVLVDMLDDSSKYDPNGLLNSVVSSISDIRFDTIRDIFYRSKEQFERMKSAHSVLKGYDHDRYVGTVMQLKGRFLERYVTEILSMLIPDSIMFPNLRYQFRRKEGEIDLVVVAQEHEVERAFKDRNYFVPLVYRDNKR